MIHLASFSSLGVLVFVGWIHVPGNLLDDVPDESGALAEVALGPRDPGGGSAGSDFLYGGNKNLLAIGVAERQRDRGSSSRNPRAQRAGG